MENKFKIYASKNTTCSRSLNGSHIDFGFISSHIEIINTTNIKQLTSEPFSDHAAIFLEISIKPAEIKYTNVKNFSKANWPMLLSAIETQIGQVSISTVRNLSASEIENYTEKITQIYNETIDKFIPNIRIKSDSIQLSNHSLALLKEKKKHYCEKNSEIQINRILIKSVVI